MRTKKKARVVIVGGGGREHALAWKLAQSPRVGKLFCLPGNPGIAALAECLPADLTKPGTLAQQILDLAPDLVVIGPEAPLVAGLADLLAGKVPAVFGPSAAAARIEGSKAFAKRLMERAGVPTATFCVADDMMKADRYISGAIGELVVKADGLCAGKGVVVCANADEAREAARAMLVKNAHGAAGKRIVIEDRLYGPEISVMALVDGNRIMVLPAAQDYKRRQNGDQGPMTGGMGSVSPSPRMTAPLMAQIRATILEPVVRQMTEDGTPFQGLLYAGLMLTLTGPMVLEFNCRFGDPETQVVLPRIAADLYDLLHRTATGNLPASGADGTLSAPVHDRAAVCVVQCAETYPAKGSSGEPITGIGVAEEMEDVTVFHAGTARSAEGKIVTGGGRVLGTTALGATISEARGRAYRAVERIHWEGEAHRSDIASRL